ncbi:MAG: SGNH/GDSL hydrolase family protein [Clostridia bacterium]|nr:SGNH/GDSL hydrolase family protein [Clostridia bacterium]
MKSIFKKLGAFCLALTTLFAPCCGSESVESESAAPSKLLPFDEYNLETYLKPVWLGDTVYNETVMFVGQRDEQRLLYPATEIISVRSYDLKTEYKSGVDYEFDCQTNLLTLTMSTRMPYFVNKAYYPEAGQYHSASMGTGLFFKEGGLISNKQLAVTYRAKKDDTLTPPKDHSQKYSSFLNKVASGQKVKICFFGDSITVGGNASGFIDIPPYMPNFANLVTEGLKVLYSNPNIEMVNHAKGGETSLWGMRNVSLVTDENPDLVVLAWGMNDLFLGAELFKNQIREMLDSIKNACPSADILLVSSMYPNGDVAEFRMNGNYISSPLTLYEKKQEELADEYGLGIALVTTMHREMLEKKAYYSMTANNINHPSDFLIRIYAQNILFALTGKTL